MSRLFEFLSKNTRTIESVLLLAVFPTLGIFSGWLIGGSRQPAVVAFLPLLFGLMSGITLTLLESRAIAIRWKKILSEKLSTSSFELVDGILDSQWRTFTFRAASSWAIGLILFCVACYWGVESGINRRTTTREGTHYAQLDSVLQEIQVNSRQFQKFQIPFDGSEIATDQRPNVQFTLSYNPLAADGWNVSSAYEIAVDADDAPIDFDPPRELGKIKLISGDQIVWSTEVPNGLKLFKFSAAANSMSIDCNDSEFDKSGKDWSSKEIRSSSEFLILTVKESDTKGTIEFQDLLSTMPSISADRIFAASDSQSKLLLQTIWWKLPTKNVTQSDAKSFFEATLIPGLILGDANLDDAWKKLETLEAANSEQGDATAYQMSDDFTS